MHPILVWMKGVFGMATGEQKFVQQRVASISSFQTAYCVIPIPCNSEVQKQWFFCVTKEILKTGYA